MSLLGVLNVGGSALAAQQAALQVTGNNLANAADPNYTREVAEQSPGSDSLSSTGLLLGTGVTVTAVQRQVDEALNQRLNSAGSDESAASTVQTVAGQVQSVFNALSGNGLSDQLNTFFNDWSTLAANPSGAGTSGGASINTGQQQVVLQDGANVAQTLNSLTSNLASLSSSVQSQVGQNVTQVNQLASQVASLNQQIVTSEAGGSQPNALLDQRDTAVGQLASLANIQTVNQADGSVSVFIGSEALVQETTAQTLSATTTNTNGQQNTSVQFADGSTANLTSGTLGGLAQSQALIDSTNDSLNSLAGSLISSLNTLHASGQGAQGFTSVTSTNVVNDATQPLSADGLQPPTTSGSFVIHVTDTTSGLSTSSLIPITETGSGGDTTLNSLASSLNGVSGVSATVSNGLLTIQSSNPNTQITFSQDTSGALAGLGINTFFSGTNASTIAVNSQIEANPALLATSGNGIGADNSVATAISNLGNTAQSGLNGQSVSQAYDGLVENIGSTAANATSNATATAAVRQTLSGQQQAISGVSTNEEALNMIIEQRTFEGAAELISTVNQMLQSLLAIT